jgi:hypothetical protein
MVKKEVIAQFLFGVTLCYIISPWFFEKNLLFNEVLAAAGLALLAYKQFRVPNDAISHNILVLLLWGMVHGFISVFRADSAYYYLRNLVIVYSIFSYFIGWFLLRYLQDFITRFRQPIQYYIGVFLFIPLPRLFFERFGVSTLFPALVQKTSARLFLPLLILLNLVYAVTYKSSTSFILGVFYTLLLIAPGYRFFKQFLVTILVCFTVFFIAIQPNLNIISLHYDYYNTLAIHEVMDSNPLLSVDGNSTWRLVLWKEVIVDLFPVNLFGMGFGTPMIKYFPVEDYSRLATLPYVLGAHNSYVYLFGRLGIIYIVLIVLIYRVIFKEYFYYKAYYYQNRSILIFWSFFAISVSALFNPVLESPIFAGVYWLLLGLLARAIVNRKAGGELTLS